MKSPGISSAGVLLRSRKIKDTEGLIKSYRIERNKKKFVDATRKRASYRVASARAKGKRSVRLSRRCESASTCYSPPSHGIYRLAA